ncbi:GNAT family N-acetyltransferase [Streptococcus thoraltensis]|uniref:GNAT family N-acetyltransferase n=1 Tax=Streptococcus thoraltensis TaxID=55085 RepID=UPI001F59E68D|nr:GNAT family N-acetyltransferase [Streptococcus thoraltensis]
MIFIEYYDAFTSDDYNLRYAFFPHASIEESWQGLVLYNLKEPIGKYGIVEKSSNRLIGNINFKQTDRDDTLEIGYTLHQDYAGQGYMTEAAHALKNLAKVLPDISYLTAITDHDNRASKTVLEKIGMTLVRQYPDKSLRGQDIISDSYQMKVKD